MAHHINDHTIKFRYNRQVFPIFITTTARYDLDALEECTHHSPSDALPDFLCCVTLPHDLEEVLAFVV